MDELRSSSSTRGISMPNFAVLDARIASALNRIIRITPFKRKVSLEEQKARKGDRFLRGRQIAYLIYDYFRVIGSHDFVENYDDVFTFGLRNDDIHEFDSKWDGILLSMTKIPPDDILEGLYKLRIRESDKLKTVLELYDLEIHQKLGPDYHRLKRTPWSRVRGQNSVDEEFLETVGNGKPTGSALKETIAVSVTMSVNVQKMTQPNSSPNSLMQQRKRNIENPESQRKSPSGRMSRWPCKDYFKGICTNLFCEKWHPPEC